MLQNKNTSKGKKISAKVKLSNNNYYIACHRPSKKSNELLKNLTDVILRSPE